MANINGTKGNDTLNGTTSDDLINGLAGDDTLDGKGGKDTLNGSVGEDTFYIGGYSNSDILTTGGSGKDKFVYLANYNNYGYSIITITDFGGIGKGSNPSAAVIAEVDTLEFTGSEQLTARNLQLTQNGNNLEITFERFASKVVLQNFALENLDNLAQVGNILFKGQTSVTNSFDVFDANSTQSTIFNKNTVTFLNDLSNNVNGFENSNDVINGQGGDDIIDGKSGNDLLRGGAGNDILIGGAGNDQLYDSEGNNTLDGGLGNDQLEALSSTGNNIFKGGSGSDSFNISNSSGNNSLSGDAGNDTFEIGYSTGNNTVLGGDGADLFLAKGVRGRNILNGGDGNDLFYLSAPKPTSSSVVTQTVDGGTGDDFLSVDYGNANGAITLTLNATTNIGLITAGTNQISFKNIERLNITGTAYDDYLVGTNRDDTLLGGGGNNTIIGGAGNDYLDAFNSSADNLLFGGDGNDSLNASGEYYGFGSGNNTVYGGAGDDYLTGFFAKGNNLFNGDDGNDYLSISASYDDFGYYSASGNNTLNGGAGNDTLLSAYTTGDNVLSGGDGNDSFYVGSPYPAYASGTQTVDGGAGDDLLSVDYSSATTGITTTFNATTNIESITAGTNQVSYKNIERLNILGTANNDNILGSNGNDTLSTGNGGNDTIDGGIGDDLLSVNYSNATAGITTTFNPTTNIGSITAGTNQVSYKNIERLNILGTANNDNIMGNNGNDTLSTGNAGNDTIDGGSGDDLLSVDYSSATAGITSTFNATTNIGSITAGTNQVSYKNIERLNILGTADDDKIVGNNGNDTLSGGNGGNDTIDGGIGDDLLSVDYSSATVGITSTFNATTNIGSITSGTNQVSYKNIERLNILGTTEDDNIVGSNGNDTLSGGYGGNDILIGGKGNDTFALNIYGQDVDRIDDFNATDDLIQISSYFDGALSTGSLSASQFTIGASATTSNQRFIYNNITGALYFDQDGIGVSTQVKLAQLPAGLSLTENNFVIAYG